MALKNYTVKNGEWKKISAKGENGSAWVKESYKGNAPSIIVAHTKKTQSPVDDIPYAQADDLDIEVSYCLISCDPPALLEADSPNDIYYATTLKKDAEMELTTDFV